MGKYFMRSLSFATAVDLVACNGAADDDDVADDDTTTVDDDTGDDDTTAGDDDTAAGDDDTGDDDTSDDDTGDDDTGDDDIAERLGMLGYLGEATVEHGQYAGAEGWYLIGDEGDGDDICRIRYDVTSVAERHDCSDCMWAFDVERSSAQITSESDVGCAGTLGYDASTVGDLDGTRTSYGYAPDYVGHAQVLMVDSGSGWTAVTFALWDDGSSKLTYDWEMGHQAY